MRNLVIIIGLVLIGGILSPVYSQLISDLPQDQTITFEDLSFMPDTQTEWLHLYNSGFEADPGSQSIFGTIREKPGLAFLSSALIPGLGQAANQQWWKTALFAGIEIGAIALYFERRSHARKVEQDYINMANNKWSVVQYARFLVDYNEQTPWNNREIHITDMLTQAGLQHYMQNGTINPAFNNDFDWAMINLSALNQFEMETRYQTGFLFSHVVPAYGSQQYYELVSKYFQFAPGWVDWNGDISVVDGQIPAMSPLWLKHARIEEEFNDAYRLSSNMLMLLLGNHVFSAFDAYFTSKLRLHRRSIQTSASLHHSGANLNLRVNF
jgi:hypothetical protein